LEAEIQNACEALGADGFAPSVKIFLQKISGAADDEPNAVQQYALMFKGDIKLKINAF
jgi:hypothetical protein